MNDNPYAASSTAARRHHQPEAPRSTWDAWIGRAASLGLLIFATLYLTNLISTASDSITLTTMLAMTSPTSIVAFKVAYIMALVSSVLGYAANRRFLGIVAALVIVASTSAALAMSTPQAHLRPLLFVQVRIGELMTIAAALLMLYALRPGSSATRRS